MVARPHRVVLVHARTGTREERTISAASAASAETLARWDMLRTYGGRADDWHADARSVNDPATRPAQGSP